MAAADVVRKAREAEVGFPQEAVRRSVQALVERVVTAAAGAGRYGRSKEHTTRQNGLRYGLWDTGVGPLGVSHSKLRLASCSLG